MAGSAVQAEPPLPGTHAFILLGPSDLSLCQKSRSEPLTLLEPKVGLVTREGASRTSKERA